MIISAAGQCKDVTNIITPVATAQGGDLYYIDFAQDEFHLGGSSFAQSLTKLESDPSSTKRSLL